MPCSERRKEIKRRRSRGKKLSQMHKRVEKASSSEKVEIATKIRALTPGAPVLIANWGLTED